MEYLLTVHPPTTVSHSLRARFTSPAHDTLAVIRSNSITLLDLLPSGPVEACAPVELWGRVVGAEVWTPPSSSPSSSTAVAARAQTPDAAGDSTGAGLSYLLILLDAPPKPLLLVARFSPASRTLELAARVELARPAGARENEFWQGLVVDQASGTAVAGLWCGSLTAVVLAEPDEAGAAQQGKGRAKRVAKPQGLVRSKFDVQLRDLNLLALVFVPPSPSAPAGADPTLAFLTLTPTRVPFLRTRRLALEAKDLAPLSNGADADDGQLALHVPDESAALLVPVPAADGARPAVVVVGDKTLTVYEVGGASGGATGKSTATTSGKGKGRAGSGSGAAAADQPSPGAKRRRSSAASSSASVSLTGRGDGLAKVPRLEDDADDLAGPGGSGARAGAVTGKMPISEITAWEIVDSDAAGARVLLGDSHGQLKLAVLKRGQSLRIESVETIVLGTTSPAKCLTYLTSAHLFVGSHFADSLVLQILPSPIPFAGSYLAPPSSAFANLAPVLDFCVSARGEGGVVTCSGGNGAGSLRVVRDGAGWEEELRVEGVDAVDRVWSVPSPLSPGEAVIIASTTRATHFLSVAPSDDPMADVPPPPTVTLLAGRTLGLEQSQPTLCIGASGASLVQVTTQVVIFVDSATGQRSEWKPAGPWEEVGVAAVGEGLVLLGLTGGRLVLLRASETGLVVAGSRQLPSEISALALSSTTAAVALWDLSLQTVDLSHEGLPALSSFPPTPALARSLLFSTNDKPDQPRGLLAGLGDGTVVVSLVSAAGTRVADSDVRKLSLGATEVHLTAAADGAIVATCDRPAVLSLEERGRVGYKYITVKDVSAACAVSLDGQANTLLFVTPEALLLGRIDHTSKTQIQTIPFGAESPYRIAFHPELKAYGVAFVKSEIDRFREEEVVSSSFKLLGGDDFKATFTHELELGERATALELVHLRSKLGNQAAAVFLLGTATLDPALSEVQRGRILVFNAGNDGKLHLSRAINVAGMVYAFSQLADGFAATVNSRVMHYTLDPGVHFVGADPKIIRRSQWTSAYLPASLAPVGDAQLLVGDAMSSMSLVGANVDSDLLTVAKDLKPLWLTSVGAISETNFVGADVGCNLSTFRLADAKLETGGAIHLGDIVNKFRKGSLRPNQHQHDVRASANLVLATTAGRVAVLADLLGPETSHVLFDLQRNMARVIRGFGGVAHADWRAFRHDAGARPSAGFIDGDFVERFLDVRDEALVQEILDGANKYERIEVPYAELCSLLEGLRRIH